MFGRDEGNEVVWECTECGRWRIIVDSMQAECAECGNEEFREVEENRKV